MENEQLTELLSVLYIQSLRIYDVLMFIAKSQGVDINKIEEMHTEGRTLCPDPALYIEEEDES